MPRKNLMMALIILVVVILGYVVLTTPDQRSTGQRIGDAIDALPEGPGKAARELEKRTPGEKLGDEVKDLGNDIKRSTDNQ
jgi:hypothetical protein